MTALYKELFQSDIITKKNKLIMLTNSAFILACLSATVLANKTKIAQSEAAIKSRTTDGLGIALG